MLGKTVAGAPQTAPGDPGTSCKPCMWACITIFGTSLGAGKLLASHSLVIVRVHQSHGSPSASSGRLACRSAPLILLVARGRIRLFCIVDKARLSCPRNCADRSDTNSLQLDPLNAPWSLPDSDAWRCLPLGSGETSSSPWLSSPSNEVNEVSVLYERRRARCICLCCNPHRLLQYPN